MARVVPAPLDFGRARPWVADLIADRRLAAALALALALATGLLTAFFAPRGPTTSANALAIMATAFLVGLTGGALSGSRWVLLPLFVTHVVGVELGRIDIVGPSLALRLDSPYGIIALVLTRGFHGVLLVLPLAFGVILGIVYARPISRGDEPARRRHRPVGSVLVGIATIGLATLVAWPASTPPVLDPSGRPIPGSIAELTTVHLGATDQTVMIRAAHRDRPVLLYLAGGPGQSDMALVRAMASGWEQDFVVVALDQRGNGKSYPAIDPVSSLTLDRAVSDVVELTLYLRDRFAEPKIYLMGESWGTILGVRTVQAHPDLYAAYIGSGQMVDVVETDRRVYADLVDHAERTGDAELSSKLTAIGQPPYRDIPWANSNLLAWYDYLYKPYTPSATYVARLERAGLDPFGLLGSEYSMVEKTDVLRGLLDTFAILYPQLYGIDFRHDVPRLEVPVYILDGAAELAGRRDLALEWFAQLQAPSKRLITFENAAHAVEFEQADEVQRLLNETIIPATYPR